MVRMKLLLLLALMSALVIPVFAEQQVAVPLPFDRPFVDHNCQTFFANTIDSIKARAVVNCYWVWEYDASIIPDIKKLVPNPSIVPNDELPPNVMDLVNDSPPPRPEDVTEPTDEGSGLDDRIDTRKETVDAIAKLAECYRGYDRSHEWGAFVDTQLIPFWLDKTRANFEARDNLNQESFDITDKIKVPLLPILKAIEECSAIQRYVDLHMIGSREALMAVHDKLNIGKDGKVVPTIRANEGLPKHESDSTRNIEPLKVAEDRAREFACNPDNIARHLCSPYSDFTGVNRGIIDPIVSRDTIVNSPNSPMKGKTAVDVMSAYNLAKDKRINTPELTAKYLAEINQITCDNYFPAYKHKLGTEDFPEWLGTACMKGTKSTQFDLLQRHALE